MIPAGPPPATMHVVLSGASWRHPVIFASNTSGRVGGFLNWWDGVELWLTGLPFVAQTAVVMPVVLMLAFGLAVLLDGALGNGIRLLRRARHQDQDDGASE